MKRFSGPNFNREKQCPAERQGIYRIFQKFKK